MTQLESSRFYDNDDSDVCNSNDECELEKVEEEDTEESSETDDISHKNEKCTEIKEQMYLDKLTSFKKQLSQLSAKKLPEYVRMIEQIDRSCDERIIMNKDWFEYKEIMIEASYHKDIKYANENFKKKKTELKDNLIIELEEKKKSIEQDKNYMEIGSDNIDSKTSTRKLRRRANEPIPMPDKRRKTFTNQVNYMIDEEAIMQDLRIINKISGKPLARKLLTANISPSPVSLGPVLTFGVPRETKPAVETLYEAKIDDGRLQYDRKWFHRGQSVYVESKEHNKVPAVISAVGTQEIWLRKTEDNDRLRVFISQLQNGRFTIKRRST